MSKVISLDLEMNQPSNKIIQIGYVIGDIRNGRIFEKKSLIVNPKEELGFVETDKGMVHICDFTGISEESIKNGIDLSEAYQIMCEDIIKHNPTRTVVQWGDGGPNSRGDHDEIRKQLNLTWAEFIFRTRSWDVKMIYQVYRAFNNKSVASGLSSAMNHLNLEFSGRPHDALDDAYNTFLCFCKIGKKMSRFDQIKGILDEN